MFFFYYYYFRLLLTTITKHCWPRHFVSLGKHVWLTRSPRCCRPMPRRWLHHAPCTAMFPTCTKHPSFVSTHCPACFFLGSPVFLLLAYPWGYLVALRGIAKCRDCFLEIASENYCRLGAALDAKVDRELHYLESLCCLLLLQLNVAPNFEERSVFCNWMFPDFLLSAASPIVADVLFGKRMKKFSKKRQLCALFFQNCAQSSNSCGKK